MDPFLKCFFKGNRDVVDNPVPVKAPKHVMRRVQSTNVLLVLEFLQDKLTFKKKLNIISLIL